MPAIDQSSRPAATDDIFDQKPQLALQNALIKRVSSVLPSLSLKTGGTLFENINDQGEQPWSLFRSLDAMGNGIPVLFLDVVERTPLVSGGSRVFLIEQAKREYLAHQKRLFAHGVVDTFNVCALAHFCLECFIEWRGALSSFGVRLFHTAMCAVMAAGCATFLSHVLFEELGGTPIGIGKLLAAKAEIATVSAFVLYLCTYLETFRYAQIHFSISLRDNLGRSMSGVLLNEYGDDGAPTPLPIHES